MAGAETDLLAAPGTANGVSKFSTTLPELASCPRVMACCLAMSLHLQIIGYECKVFRRLKNYEYLDPSAGLQAEAQLRVMPTPPSPASLGCSVAHHFILCLGLRPRFLTPSLNRMLPCSYSPSRQPTLQRLSRYHGDRLASRPNDSPERAMGRAMVHVTCMER